MRINEILSERKLSPPSSSDCSVKVLSNVRRAQCVSRGLRAHDSDHTDGTGKQGVKGSGKSLKGRKVKGEKFGGPVKDYGSRSRGRS
jgi:hypothetical protein